MAAGCLLTIAGCATSPEEEHRRQEMEADIDEIVAYELDEAEYGGPSHCLSDHDYRSFRALGDRHLLFEGRNDKLWINVLRARCRGLDEDSKFIMKVGVSGRVCKQDQFEVSDQLDSLAGSGIGPVCFFGEFKPATEAQVAEIEDRLEMN